MEPGSSLQSSSADDESMTRPTEQADVRQNDARRRRHKVNLACEACRARKIKSDGAIPVCGTCRRRRNTPEKCLFISLAAVRGAISQESASLYLTVCVIHERELHINLLTKGM